ncbi:hypothetical protein HHK36_000374 [Tetracentron sinense]|uniref:MSP domain-containing protein n=1 Tax=Tetracentron sinense TaxID=13715 RepID=A0A834ZVE1_TETSI|nr:hypothetical protein HHK36_000374 [Tetracentron sinense]
MSIGDLLDIHPTELKFICCYLHILLFVWRLFNLGSNVVSNLYFHKPKFKTTSPKKYCVHPNNGIVSPCMTCDVTVTMQAQKEAPLDLQCKDKFLLQSVTAPSGATAKDITPEMFNKEAGKDVDEFKLRVIYIPANPPSRVSEDSEEVSSSQASVLDNENQNAVSVSFSFCFPF